MASIGKKKEGNAKGGLGFPILFPQTDEPLPLVISVPNIDGAPYTTPIDFKSGSKLILKGHNGKGKFYWDPGYTEEGIKPHMEYMGKPKQMNMEIHENFEGSIGPFMGKLNKKKREEAGMKEIAKNFKKYCDDLHQLYMDVGFKGRDPAFAEKHLMINLLKSQVKKETQALLDKYAKTKTTEICERFLTVEPWESQTKTIKDSIMYLTPQVTEAQMGSWCTSVNNGDTPDLPSIYLQYIPGETYPSLARLGKWFESGKKEAKELYEIRIEFPCEMDLDDDPPFYTGSHSVKTMWSFLENFCKGLAHAKFELFTLKGTLCIQDDQYAHAGQQKLATKILLAMKSTNKEVRQTLGRINISNCWIDFDFFEGVLGLVGESDCTALRLSNLRLGVAPKAKTKFVASDSYFQQYRIPPSQQMKYPPGAGSLCQPACCCSLCCFGCEDCDAPVDVTDLSDKVYGGMDVFRAEHAHLAAGCAGTLVKIFKQMAVNAGEEGSVDVIDIEGTKLPALCGTAEAVLQVLETMSMSQPSAIKLKRCGLADVHAAGICKMFFNNPNLLHFEVGLTCCETDGAENMQNLFQNSPTIVSGRVEIEEEQLQVKVAGQITLYEEEKAKCCGGQDIDASIACLPCCCFKYTERTLSQELLPVGNNKFYAFPKVVRSIEEFSVFADTIKDEVAEHQIVPIKMILASLWKGDVRKEKMLLRVTNDKQYAPVFADNIDKEKLDLMKMFFEKLMVTTSVEQMWKAKKAHFGETMYLDIEKEVGLTEAAARKSMMAPTENSVRKSIMKKKASIAAPSTAYEKHIETE